MVNVTIKSGVTHSTKGGNNTHQGLRTSSSCLSNCYIPKTVTVTVYEVKYIQGTEEQWLS